MFTLPELPFSAAAFQPFITEEGFDYHHGKHHQAYVTNLNKLLDDSALAGLPLEQIIRESHQQTPALFNNAAQHFNHSFYWNCLSPGGGGHPRGRVAELIERDFGGYESFRGQFSDAAVKLFGSGWAWLVSDEAGRLSIQALKDAATPIANGGRPILTLDVWEHAYYIDHRNQRPRFVEGFWDVVNWDFANSNLED